MHPLVYVMLIAGGTLAHYRGGYVSHNLFEREEPENDVDREERVECPVCENSSSWLLNNEECPIVSGGKSYKKCKYGAYDNKACGNRRDCYRGPKERCTEKMTVDLYDQRCAPGYYCNPIMRECTGIDYAVSSNELWWISPNQRYQLPDHQLPNHHFPSENFRYPIRTRREA